ncbi:MAG: hypothetical protein ACRENP_10615 [Longimicrobiales bacterium]
MSSRPPGQNASNESEPVAKRDEALFSHLFASRPAKQRRTGIWLLALAAHLPLLYFFFTTELGERVLRQAELILIPVLTVDDNPPAIVHPSPVVPVGRIPDPGPSEEERRRAAAAAAVPEPGILNPTAITPLPSILPGPPQPIPGDGPRGGSLLDRLAPPRPDPLLLAPTDPSHMLTGPAAARARMAERVRALNDSVAAERLAAERSTDWTVMDKDGKRWGVSPGKLHLGDVTLPLPLAFATPPGRRDEANARVRDWNEIEAGSSRAQIKDNFNDRVKEIRKRKDRERAAKIADQNGDKKKSGSD